MIQANELRIGNLLNYNRFGECRIITIDPDHIRMCFDFNDEFNLYYQPIPITKEWLFKLGFTQSPVFKSLFFKGMILNITLGSKIMFEINDQIIDEIKYVHQLQNLYFALTQKELEYVGKD